jgi:hypothetical protein
MSDFVFSYLRQTALKAGRRGAAASIWARYSTSQGTTTVNLPATQLSSTTFNISSASVSSSVKDQDFGSGYDFWIQVIPHRIWI